MKTNGKKRDVVLNQGFALSVYFNPDLLVFCHSFNKQLGGELTSAAGWLRS